MRERVDGAEHRPQGRGVTAVDREQDLPHRLPGLGKGIVDRQLHPVKDDFAGERVAVGVQARRGIADELIARDHAVPIQRRVLFDDPDDRPCQIVVPRLIEIRHLRRLAAGQRHVVRPAAARHARHDLLGDFRHEVPGCDIVEERERRGAVHQDVIDRVIDEIFTDRVVHARRRGDEHFRPDTIGRHHEHRLLVAFGHADHPTEAADSAASERRPRRADQLGDAPLRLIRRVQPDAGRRVAIGLRHSSPSREKCTRSRNAFTRPRTSCSVICSRRWTPNASTASDPIADP